METLKSYGEKNIKSGLARDLFDDIDWDNLKSSSKKGSAQRSVAALKVMSDSYGDNPLIATDISYNFYLGEITKDVELGQASDIAFAMTKAFGGGHSVDYYKSQISGEGSENFANIFSTRSKQSGRVSKRIIDSLVPNQVKFIEDLIK